MENTYDNALKEAGIPSFPSTHIYINDTDSVLSQSFDAYSKGVVKQLVSAVNAEPENTVAKAQSSFPRPVEEIPSKYFNIKNFFTFSKQTVPYYINP